MSIVSRIDFCCWWNPIFSLEEKHFWNLQTHVRWQTSLKQPASQGQVSTRKGHDNKLEYSEEYMVHNQQ